MVASSEQASIQSARNEATTRKVPIEFPFSTPQRSLVNFRGKQQRRDRILRTRTERIHKTFTTQIRPLIVNLAICLIVSRDYDILKITFDHIRLVSIL